jgi:hypothetical protein
MGLLLLPELSMNYPNTTTISFPLSFPGIYVGWLEASFQSWWLLPSPTYFDICSPRSRDKNLEWSNCWIKFLNSNFEADNIQPCGVQLERAWEARANSAGI